MGISIRNHVSATCLLFMPLIITEELSPKEMPGINASVQTATVWSIRNLLVAAVSLLALFAIGVSGYVLRNASLERALGSDAASDRFADDVLTAAMGTIAEGDPSGIPEKGAELVRKLRDEKKKLHPDQE